MTSSSTPKPRLGALVVVLALAGCGGGSGDPAAPVVNNVPPAVNKNVLPIRVASDRANSVNIPYVSVTICAPGSSICQTIDQVIVDTGSTGLRIMASALSPSLALTQRTASNGGPLVECTQFTGGYIWGPIKAVDTKLDGETLRSLAIQIIADPGFAHVPSSCSSIGPDQGSVQALGGNGILGVGVFQQDCGSLCANAAIPGTYYACSGSICQPVVVDLARQVLNPVGLLATDNNGVVIDLPAVGATGAKTVNGSLILGIGTQANNALGNAVVFALDPATGTLTTVINGKRLTGSLIDSGSNALFFPDGAMPLCGNGFYCPASVQQLSATNLGTNGATGSVSFTVDSADSLFASGNTAFNNLAGPSFGFSSFDWGLPFHFGRRVYTAIEGKNSPGGSGPYVAY